MSAYSCLPADSALVSIKTGVGKDSEMVSIDEVRVKQIAHIEVTLHALEGIHKGIAGLTSKSRERKIKSHNARTHVRECNFEVGDFVLRGFSQKKKKNKLSLRWRGPFLVTKVLSDFLFEVEDLRSGDRKVVHGTRIKFFRNKEFNVTSDCEEQLVFQAEEYCVVDEIQDIRVQDGEVQVVVRWKGFQDEEPGWEDISVMKEDVPALVVDFLNEMRDSGTKRQKTIASTC